MENMMFNYALAVSSLGILALLMLVQVLVLDFTSIRRRHPPGQPINGGPEDFLFRAARAHGNSNENLPTLLLIAAFCFLVGADPDWVNPLMLAFVSARAGHMLCYYANLQILRSVFFGIGLLAMIGILVAGILTL